MLYHLEKINPRIIPQKSPADISNFDADFTNEQLKTTPTDKLFLMNLDQNMFAGFSYVNPEFIVTV